MWTMGQYVSGNNLFDVACRKMVRLLFAIYAKLYSSLCTSDTFQFIVHTRPTKLLYVIWILNYFLCVNFQNKVLLSIYSTNINIITLIWMCLKSSTMSAMSCPKESTPTVLIVQDRRDCGQRSSVNEITILGHPFVFLAICIS